MSDATLVWLTVLAVVAVVWWRATAPQNRSSRGRVGGVGSAAAGAIYDLLNEEKRNALEVVVEERAGERDPEDRQGTLPQLDKSKLRT